MTNIRGEEEADSVGTTGTAEAISSGPQRAPRSCQVCHFRKIKCDKRQPCAQCSKAGKTCVYPPAGPRSRRTKRTINAEMASRIAYLEKTLGKVARATKEDVAARSSIPHGEDREMKDPVTTGRTTAPSEFELRPASWSKMPRDILVCREGTSIQYFNDIVLSRVLNEVSQELIIGLH